MKVCILLYGYFYVDPAVNLWRAAHSKNQLKKYSFVHDGYHHFIESVYEPMKTMYNEIDVYMITHEFMHPKFKTLKQELIDTCKGFTIFFTNAIESPKLPYTYYNLVNKVSNIAKYDRYFITRGDLIYKRPIDQVLPKYTSQDACWFCFKDHKNTWDEKKIMCDIMFVIDNNLEKFKKCIRRHIELWPERTEMHGIYFILKENFGDNVSYLAEGYYDSNTSKKVIESNNPVYIMVNRPYYFDRNGAMKNADQSQARGWMRPVVTAAATTALVPLRLEPATVHPIAIEERKFNLVQQRQIMSVNEPKIERGFYGNNKIDIIELYKQRVNEKLEKQKEQKIFLSELVPTKMEGLTQRKEKIRLQVLRTGPANA